MPDKLSIPLLALLAASAFCYVGTHLLWGGLGAFRSCAPRVRGILYALPLIMIATYLASRGYGWVGISILTTGSVAILTLGLGVCAISLNETESLAVWPTRMLLPVCLVVLLSGMSGELTFTHAALILLVGGLAIWSSESVVLPEMKPVHGLKVGIAIVCFVGWLLVLKFSTDKLEMGILQRISPIVVSLWILAAVGLLVGDIHAQAADNAVSTISTTVIGLLGFGLPLVIVCGTVFPRVFPTEDSKAEVIMSQPTWRIDCLLLAVVAGLLFQATGRKFGIGRGEGGFLIAICLVFMFVTVWYVRS